MKCTCKNGRKEIKVCVGVADINGYFLEQYVKKCLFCNYSSKWYFRLEGNFRLSWEFALSSKVRLYNVKKVGKKIFLTVP